MRLNRNKTGAHLDENKDSLEFFKICPEQPGIHLHKTGTV